MEGWFNCSSGGERDLHIAYDRQKTKDGSVEPHPPPRNPPPPPRNPPPPRYRLPSPNPPQLLNTDGTFTTRVHYNGLMSKPPKERYIGGLVECISNCDPDKWSRLEVDDVLERKGLDITWLEYYFVKSRMNMNEGLVRLFDNQSSMEMSEIGLKEGVVDLYAVNELEPAHDGDEVTEGAVLVSQLTQEEVADVDKETEVEVEVTDGEDETELEVNDGEEDMASGDEEHEKQVKEKKSVASTKKNTSEDAAGGAARVWKHAGGRAT